MYSDEILKQIADVVAEQLSVPIEKVVPAAHLSDELGADSLDLVELVMAFEEKFNVEIPDDVADTIKTVGDAATYIARVTKK